MDLKAEHLLVEMELAIEVGHPQDNRPEAGGRVNPLRSRRRSEGGVVHAGNYKRRRSENWRAKARSVLSTGGCSVTGRGIIAFGHPVLREFTIHPDESPTLPTFLIIGAAKSGTTNLCNLLKAHPDIYIPKAKESRYFSNDKNYALGLESYSRFFALAGQRRAIGEGSTHYSMLPAYPQTAERIARDLPEVRIIYIVRDPIERIASQWRMLASMEVATNSFDVDIRNPALSYYYVDRSRYWYQISAYRRHFPDESILVLFFEDFKDRPFELIERCARFLELGPIPEFNTDSVWLNASVNYRKDRRFLSALRQRAFFERLKAKVPRRYWQGARFALTRSAAPPVRVTFESRAWLRNQLRADTRQFLDFYGKPPDYWQF